MCDGDHPRKLMTQFLITNDLRFVVSDLDALPLVDKLNALVEKCGHRQFRDPQMRAPEQDWPFPNEEFRYEHFYMSNIHRSDESESDEKMPGYDERSDIWKLPDGLSFILDSRDASMDENSPVNSVQMRARKQVC
jgi:glycoprotein-mannosyl O6-kinase